PAERRVLPAASTARARSVCAPFGTERVSHASAYGAAESGDPVSTPSTRNWTRATPTSSVASAVTLTMPFTDAPLVGEVIDTLGSVLSVDPVSALKATRCDTQPLPFWVISPV